MTMVESLPAYASAAAVAKSKGDNLLSMINAYLAGYASAGAPVDVPVDADGYPVFKIDESKVDVVRPKTDPATGKHVWPKGFIDD